MLANLLGLAVLVAVTALLVWLSLRAWRARNLLIRFLGGIVTSLLALLFILVTGLTAVGLFKIYAPSQLPAVTVQVQGTPDQVARGQHLAQVVCADCHSENQDLPLSGSTKNLVADTGLPAGALYPANLTPGGDLKNWSDEDVFRAIRYNRSPDGKALLMPVAALHNLSDDDTKALVAYVRSQPAVAQETPDSHPSLLTAAFVGANIFNITPPTSTQAVTAPPKGPTAEYGSYIVGYIGCRDCHGANLEGASSPDPAPNLRVVKGWTQDQFIATLRSGVDPGGHQLSEFMPWKAIGRLDDEELTAIYAYLHALP